MRRFEGRRILGMALGAALLLPGAAGARAAEGELRGEIDRLVSARAGGPAAGRTSDAEFLRRVTLDLAGTLPTAAEARSFLADADPRKRERLVDRLLASPDHARRMEQAVSVMLMERRAGEAVPDAAWRRYLRDSFAANKPWDQLVREVVLADSADPVSRPALRFFLDGRQADPHRMAQDVGRLFLGMNLQCAQCHDHPTVRDWKQADYYGLLAFLSSSRLQRAKDGTVHLVEAVPAPRLEFQSVFSPDEKRATGPRLPGGKEVAVPLLEKGQEFAEPPRDGLPGVPKLRLRVLLAGELAAGGRHRLARTSVNRFWFLMLGRGLVHPLDMDHPGNPPSHPELLELLARDFVVSGFDVRRLLREIALSETYQRSGTLPAGVDPKRVPPESYRAAFLKPLSAEQLAWSAMRATGSLERILKAPAPERSSFTFKDYSNGRIPDPPSNLPDTLELFTAVFGNPPGEPEVEFQPSAAHTLFLVNERLLLQWLEPAPGSLVERLLRLEDPGAAAEELYLSVLTRLPEAEEREEVAGYLRRGGARRAAALADLAWALLASAEFRFNH